MGLHKLCSRQTVSGRKCVYYRVAEWVSYPRPPECLISDYCKVEHFFLFMTNSVRDFLSTVCWRVKFFRSMSVAPAERVISEGTFPLEM